MTVGIVIPAFNAERYLKDTVLSVVMQSYAQWRLVIVDDGSTDDTWSIIGELSKIDMRITGVSQGNVGVSGARNRGYAEIRAHCESVLFLDSDDLLEVDALEHLSHKLSACPECAGAYGLASSMDHNGALAARDTVMEHQLARHGVQDGKVVDWPIDEPTSFAVEAVTEVIITPGTVLLRCAPFDAAGRFTEGLALWEDWDLWLRVTRIGPLAFFPGPVLRYRAHAQSASHSGRSLEHASRTVREGLLASVRNDTRLRRTALLGAAFHERSILAKRCRWAIEAITVRDPRTAISNLVHVPSAAFHAVCAMLRLAFTRDCCV
jgi:glycosyltransferase involved in cell wall biosynthesis